MNSKP